MSKQIKFPQKKVSRPRIEIVERKLKPIDLTDYHRKPAYWKWASDRAKAQG